ncbi:MAG: TolC family protein [Spirochaetes bacterium]|nr:TolC family protein [Spirochaetota bacterium]
MKYFFAVTLISAAITAVLIQPALSQNAKVDSIHSFKKRTTIEECIDIAMQHHPDIKVSQEDKKIAMSKYRFSKAANKILINGEVKTIEYLTSTSSTGDTTFTITGQDTSVALFVGFSASYTIFDANKRRNEESARIGLDLAKSQSQKTINEIVLNVKRSYYMYLMAEENLKLRSEILNKYQEKLKLSRMLFNSGQRPILDVSKAEVSFSEAQLEFEKAKNNKRMMKSQLFSAMGIDEATDDIELMDYDELPELKYSVDDLYKLGELYYPDILIINTQKRINKYKIEIERAKRYPTVNMYFSLSYQNNGIWANNQFGELIPGHWTPTFNGAFQAKMPIYDGGAISALVDSARSEYNKTIFQEREIIMKMKNEIRSNCDSLNELMKQIKMSRLVIENAEKHFTLAQRSYETGAGSQLDMQDAQVSVINAKIGFITAKYTYLNTLSKLSATVGLGEVYLCKRK